MLAIAGHAVGWPFPRGGSQSIADALVSLLKSLGGEVVCDAPVTTRDELPPSRAVFCDISPRQVVQIAGDRLPPGYRRQSERYRYGPGAFKLDHALDGPIPWKSPEVSRAATVHLGGASAEITASERAIWRGEVSETPYVLLAQPSLFDDTRAPVGKHTAWADCHVPNGYTGKIVWDTSKPNGQSRRCLDTDRARQLFGFQAGTDFQDGLRRTIQWYEQPVKLYREKG